MNIKNKPQHRNNSKRKFKELSSPKIFSGNNIVSKKKGDQKNKKAFFNKKNFQNALKNNSACAIADEKFVVEQKSNKYASFAKKLGASMSSFVEKTGSMPNKKKWKKENNEVEESDVPAANSSPNQDECMSAEQPAKKTKKRKSGFSSYSETSEPKTAGVFRVSVEDEPGASMESKYLKSKSTAVNETVISGPEYTTFSVKKKKNKNKYRKDQSETSGGDNENTVAVNENPSFESENKGSFMMKKKKKDKKNKYHTEQDLSQTEGHVKSNADVSRTNLDETETIVLPTENSDGFSKNKKNKKKFKDQSLGEMSGGDNKNAVTANENFTFETKNKGSLMKKKKNMRNKYRTEQNFIAAKDNSSEGSTGVNEANVDIKETIVYGSGYEDSVVTKKNKKITKKFAIGQNLFKPYDQDNKNAVAGNTNNAFETENKGSFMKKKNKNKYRSVENSLQATGHNSSKENADVNKTNIGANNITTEVKCKNSAMKGKKNKNKFRTDQGSPKMTETDSGKETAAANASGAENSIVSVKKKKNKYRAGGNSLEMAAQGNKSRSETSKTVVNMDDTVKNRSILAKFGSIVKKRKAMEDPAESQDKTGKQSKRKKVSSVSEMRKLSKQAKKIKNELPGLDEPELTKYRATQDLDMLDDTKEESSDENFHDTSDDSSNEENEKDKSDQHNSMLQKLKKDTPEKLKKTVFVGNLPLSMTSMKLKKFFSCCGKVEAVRFRSSVPEKLSIPKKVANIRHKYSDITTSLKAYVVFAELESVKSALELNGTVIDGHHICVDRAVETKQDPERCVFVGNLPYDVDDESLWKAFSEIGQVKSIRVVRDRENGVGKGFGFVQFVNQDSVDEAVKVSEAIEIGGRKIRIKKSEFVPKQKQAGARRFQKIKGELSPKHGKARAGQQAKAYWKPIGKEVGVNSPGREKPKRRSGFKKMRKEAEDRGSRKTLKKLMIKKRLEQKKKKISSLLQK